MYYDILLEKMKKVSTKAKEIELIVNPQNLNSVVGYKRENLNKLEEMYDINIVVRQDIKQKPDKVDVVISKKHKDFMDDDENVKEKV